MNIQKPEQYVNGNWPQDMAVPPHLFEHQQQAWKAKSKTITERDFGLTPYHISWQYLRFAQTEDIQLKSASEGKMGALLTSGETVEKGHFEGAGVAQGVFLLIFEIIHLLIGKNMVSLSVSSVKMRVEIF